MIKPPGSGSSGSNPSTAKGSKPFNKSISCKCRVSDRNALEDTMYDRRIGINHSRTIRSMCRDWQIKALVQLGYLIRERLTRSQSKSFP